MVTNFLSVHQAYIARLFRLSIGSIATGSKGYKIKQI